MAQLASEMGVQSTVHFGNDTVRDTGEIPAFAGMTSFGSGFCRDARTCVFLRFGWQGSARTGIAPVEAGTARRSLPKVYRFFTTCAVFRRRGVQSTVHFANDTVSDTGAIPAFAGMTSFGSGFCRDARRCVFLRFGWQGSARTGIAPVEAGTARKSLPKVYQYLTTYLSRSRISNIDGQDLQDYLLLSCSSCISMLILFFLFIPPTAQETLPFLYHLYGFQEQGSANDRAF